MVFVLLFSVWLFRYWGWFSTKLVWIKKRRGRLWMGKLVAVHTSLIITLVCSSYHIDWPNTMDITSGITLYSTILTASNVRYFVALMILFFFFFFGSKELLWDRDQTKLTDFMHNDYTIPILRMRVFFLYIVLIYNR